MSNEVDKAQAWDAIAQKNAEIYHLRAVIAANATLISDLNDQLCHAGREGNAAHAEIERLQKQLIKKDKALTVAREEIVIAIAFLNRDANSSRLDITASKLAERFAKADANIRAALTDDHQSAATPSLATLRQAIIANTTGDLFWIGEILLVELEKETGFNGSTCTSAYSTTKGD